MEDPIEILTKYGLTDYYNNLVVAINSSVTADNYNSNINLNLGKLLATAEEKNISDEDDAILRKYIKTLREQQAKTQQYTEQAGGGYTTVLGRRRKVVMKGRTKCVNVKGELVALSKAKAMEKKMKK